MRIFTSFFCALLVVGGVSGVERKEVTLSVMKGDNVTLNPDDAEIKTGDTILWKFEGSIIGKRISGGSISTYDGPGGIFKEKLLLDKQTGCLTITDLTTDHTGLYQLEIKNSTTETWINYSVTVSDVVESVSVMEGDSVTLHTGVKLQGDDKIVWKFGDKVIPITNLNSAADSSWSNIHLNNETRDLTIRNIRRDQFGLYKVEANTRSMILYRKFPISHVTGGVKTISVKEGEIIIFHTGVIDIDKEGYNHILWKTKDVTVGEINKKTNRSYRNEEIYKGRLQLHPESGYLIISDSRTTDSGEYYLNMSSSTHTLQRTITVTVTAQSGAPSGICGAGVGLVVWVVTVFLLQEV